MKARGEESIEKKEILTTAHLLSDHDSERGEGGTTDARNSEQLEEAGDVVALPNDGLLNLDLRVDVEEIPGSLERGVAEAAERLVGLGHLAASDVPTGRLGAKVDTQGKGNGRNESGSKLQTPGKRTGVHHSQVGAEAQENTESGPELPAHDEAAANGSRGVLSAEDRNGRSLQTHSDAKQKTGDEELGPCLGTGRPDGRKCAEDRGNENGSTTAKETVDRIRKPAAQHGRGDVWRRVDNTHDPLAHGGVLVDTKSNREGQISTVRSGLIPASVDG